MWLQGWLMSVAAGVDDVCGCSEAPSPPTHTSHIHMTRALTQMYEAPAQQLLLQLYQ